MGRGKRIKLGNGRRLVSDLIRIANAIPAAGIATEYELRPVAQLRRRIRPKLSWNILYMKAYALVASETPVLNQYHVGFPFAHLYQSDSVVCMMTISRQYRGEDRLLFARFTNPQNYSLHSLQQQYCRFRDDPVDSIRQFRHQIRFAGMPNWVRRLGWWTMFNLWPSKRASHVGTLGISFSSYRGIYGNRSLGPLTTVLGIDPMPRKNRGRLMLTFDHRVLDGMPACRILENIQAKLQTVVQAELQALLEQQDSEEDSEEANPKKTAA